MNNQPVIYIISDSLGETAEFVARAVGSQFKGNAVIEYVRIPYVTTKDYLLELLDDVEEHPNSIIAYTLVLPELKELLEVEALARDIETVDVLGPMMKKVKKITGDKPHGEPGLLHKMDDDYFKKIEAVEFAVKYDDGKDPRGIIHSDIVLLGVSRTSKTPLCMYLAHKGIKAANIPLVPEVKPPDELFQLDYGRVIGLKIKPEILNEIRQERLKSLGLVSDADYASMNRILRELDYADKIMKKVACPVIDVTNKAVEETASKILQIYYRGVSNEE